MHGQTTFLHTLPYTIVGQLTESQSLELCAAPDLCQMVGQACRMTSILAWSRLRVRIMRVGPLDLMMTESVCDEQCFPKR